MRLAAMERLAHDDPSPERLESLLSEELVARLRSRVADGRPIEGPVEQWQPRSRRRRAGQHTTSLSVADRAGNLVCITQSLGGEFRLRRGGAGHRRVPEQCAVLGRSRPARQQRACSPAA